MTDEEKKKPGITEGRWHVEGYTVLNDKGRAVAMFACQMGSDWDHEQNLANGRAIALVPDLILACTVALDAITGGDERRPMEQALDLLQEVLYRLEKGAQ